MSSKTRTLICAVKQWFPTMIVTMILAWSLCAASVFIAPTTTGYQFWSRFITQGHIKVHIGLVLDAIQTPVSPRGTSHILLIKFGFSHPGEHYWDLKNCCVTSSLEGGFESLRNLSGIGLGDRKPALQTGGIKFRIHGQAERG